ncbi:MAG: hypothetical protein WC521_01565 [Bdellovibrionales bacterium]
MTSNILYQRLCLMLAFQTVIADGKAGKTPDMAKRVVKFAKRMDEFCNLNIFQAFPSGTINFVDDEDAAKIDDAIATYIEERKTKGSTQIPQDKESLIQLYDRLQTRKSRRMQWQLYATAKQGKVADLVLKYLDEEIEDTNAETPQ